MKKNRYREAIAAGRIPLGHMVWEFSTRGVAKILDPLDLDFVVFDMEHSGIDTERIFDLIAWSKACSFAPFVRVPQTDYHFLARVMDAGALGVMVPLVQTVEQAQRIVDAVKYAPLGKRGLGIGAAHTDYNNPNPHQFMKEINASSVVICQMESPQGVENADAIAALPGVDNLWVGQADLSQNMGIPFDFQNPKFIEALRHVVAVAKKHGKQACIQPATMEQAQQWIPLGFNCVSWSIDTVMYRTAMETSLASIRKML